MGTRKMRLAAACPACHHQTLDYTAADLDIPYFGELLQTVIICADCGFRHSDIIVGRTHEPMRVTFRAEREEDMMVRVVRSTSGTVKIPELGVLIEPGPASEAFVSNVEGVLERVEGVVRHLRFDAETEEQRVACDARLQEIQDAREGRLPITIVLEDPFGNSIIPDDRARRDPIPPQEAEQLPRSELSFDVKELSGNGAPPKRSNPP